MSQFRVFGYILVGFCSVATSYYTFAPELQRLKDERQFKERHQEEQNPLSALEAHESTIHSGTVPEPPKEAMKTEIQKSWPGLSVLKGSFGGAGKSGDDSSSTS